MSVDPPKNSPNPKSKANATATPITKSKNEEDPSKVAKEKAEAEKPTTTDNAASTPPPLPPQQVAFQTQPPKKKVKMRTRTNSTSTDTLDLPGSGGDASTSKPEVLSIQSHDDEDEEEGGGGRSTATFRRRRRRVRAKSALPTLFVLVDSAYFIIHFTLFVIYDWSTIMVDEGSKVFNKTLEDHYCDDDTLATQICWTGIFSWGFYVISILFLIVSICRLSLKFCYICIIFKTTSVIVYFIDLIFFGLNCLSRNFYWEAGIFAVIHLPIQGFEASMLKPYVSQMKRGSTDVISVMPSTVHIGDVSATGVISIPVNQRNVRYTTGGSSDTIKSPTGSVAPRQQDSGKIRASRMYFTVD